MSKSQKPAPSVQTEGKRDSCADSRRRGRVAGIPLWILPGRGSEHPCSTKLLWEASLSVRHPKRCLTETRHRKSQGWRGPRRSTLHRPLGCFRSLSALWVAATVLTSTPFLSCILRQIIYSASVANTGGITRDDPFQAAISVPNCLGTEPSPDLILPLPALFPSHLLYTRIKIKCISNLWRYVSIQNGGRPNQRYNKVYFHPHQIRLLNLSSVFAHITYWLKRFLNFFCWCVSPISIY